MPANPAVENQFLTQSELVEWKDRTMAISRKLSDDELFEKYLEPDPNTGDPAEWRLKEEELGYPVWSVTAVLPKDRSNTAQVIHDYQISPEAMDAVWAYYRRHHWIVDVRILSNRTA